MPPALLVATRGELAPRWCADLVLDAGLAKPTPRKAANVWFGVERTTRRVVRALATSLLGPLAHAVPGRNGSLFAISAALALDDPQSQRGKLRSDDIAAVLEASTAEGLPARRQPLSPRARAALSDLATGWTRQRRRDLAVALTGEPTDETERFVRLVLRASELMDLRDHDWSATSSGGLLYELEELVMSWHPPLFPLAGAARHRDRAVVDLVDGWQVRVPWNRALLEREGQIFDNCLATYAPLVHYEHRLIATVSKRGRPVAACQLGPHGELEVALGPSNRDLPCPVRLRVRAALAQVGLLAAVPPGLPCTAIDRVAARVACRAAVLLAELLDPEPDPWSDDLRGTRTLELLGARTELLTNQEYKAIREGPSPDPVTGWATVGAMLVAVGVDDTDLARFDGRALFREAAKRISRSVLYGSIEPLWPGPRCAVALRVAARERHCPAWQRTGFADVAEQWDD